MGSFILITALFLYSYNWISVSVSETQTVEVQLGQEVTLLCPNISKHPTQTDWFRLVNRTEVSCVSAMYKSDGEASFCDGFQNRFEMSSNITTVFLKIKRVDFSDSGLYFCGFYINAHTVISNTVHLNVQDGDFDNEVDFKTESKETPDGITNLMTVVLGALTVFLTIVIIVLAVKIRKLQTAVNEEPQTERNKNLGSDDLNYAALSFQSKAKRKRRPPSERELEPNVVYAATR
uniref:Ig-like domain-containing protein n=1 Tax=Lates calcarifer TaxID=8187 RepID=A0A4W6CW77_LATCA